MNQIRLAIEIIIVWSAALLLAIVPSEFVPAVPLSAVQILSVIGVFGSLTAIVFEINRGRSSTGSERLNAESSTGTDATSTTSPRYETGRDAHLLETPTTNLRYESGENAHLPEFDLLEKVDTGRVMDINKVEVVDTGEVVILRQPRVKGTVSAQTYEQFFQRMRTYESLRDEDHIIKMLGWGGVPSPWMLAECLEGGSLHDRINQIDYQTGINIMLQVCDGLHAAHRQGIVHADLTPHNILFPNSGSISNLKISDFETGLWVAQNETIGGRISPQYAAPEQISNQDIPIDEYTDIYRAGVIAYYLFTGVHPVQEDDPAIMFKKIQSQDPIPPSRHDSNLPTQINDAILTAMAKKKHNRFDSVLHFSDEFSKAKI